MPIGGGGAKLAATEEGIDDKPLPRGAYNLDALGEDAFGSSALIKDESVK